MTKNRLSVGIALAGMMLLGAGSAQAVTITFDSLPQNTVVTNQFPEATFSSLTAGRDIRANGFGVDWGTSLPNILCSQVIGTTSDCVGDIQVDFTNPVSGLSFLSTGDDAALAAAALVDVYVNFILAATVPIVTDGSVQSPQTTDLSAFSDVTRIVIRNHTDPAGLGYDDFTFTPGATAVPEPTTLVLLGSGVAAAAMRRRRAKK